jgi:hypothetical protein
MSTTTLAQFQLQSSRGHPPLQPLSSLLSRAKADIRGLSCRLFPFFPRKPHLLGTASSCSPPPPTMPCPALSRFCIAGVLLEEPPRIADTEECAHRVCLRIADVTVMHSVTTSAIGLTATDMGRTSKLATASWGVSEGASSGPLVVIMKENPVRGKTCREVVSGALVEG